MNAKLIAFKDTAFFAYFSCQFYWRKASHMFTKVKAFA